MAIHTFNPTRARQMAAIHEKERANQFHHIRITPVENGFTVARHHQTGVLGQSHFVANADDLHDHLDQVLGEHTVHKPVGQHLAVHVPQLNTQNDDLIVER